VAGKGGAVGEAKLKKKKKNIRDKKFYFLFFLENLEA
jgi:hypothetical protein